MKSWLFLFHRLTSPINFTFSFDIHHARKEQKKIYKNCSAFLRSYIFFHSLDYLIRNFFSITICKWTQVNPLINTHSQRRVVLMNFSHVVCYTFFINSTVRHVCVCVCATLWSVETHSYCLSSLYQLIVIMFKYRHILCAVLCCAVCVLVRLFHLRDEFWQI